MIVILTDGCTVCWFGLVAAAVGRLGMRWMTDDTAARGWSDTTLSVCLSVCHRYVSHSTLEIKVRRSQLSVWHTHTPHSTDCRRVAVAVLHEAVGKLSQLIPGPPPHPQCACTLALLQRCLAGLSTPRPLPLRPLTRLSAMASQPARVTPRPPAHCTAAIETSEMRAFVRQWHSSTHWPPTTCWRRWRQPTTTRSTHATTSHSSLGLLSPS